ncbi:MAG: hypothetical protein LBI82_00370, partial [Dysgonamonadaceae bacterium]|nr:hypothetical protein [Dysgonamonadaceae bacterium]
QAIEHENKEIITLLIDNGADVNNGALWQAIDVSVDGTLQIEGEMGDEPTDIIKLLIDRGAKVNSEDIDLAREYKSTKIVTFLDEYIPKH